MPWEKCLCSFWAHTDLIPPTMCWEAVTAPVPKLGSYRVQGEGARHMQVRTAWFRKPGVGT